MTTFAHATFCASETGREAASGCADLVIMGNGFFVVRDPINNGKYATQCGHFTLDSQGYLVTSAGARLQGRSHGALPVLGDLQINASGSTISCFFIDKKGKIMVHLLDGTTFLRGQIMLQNFQEPQALVREGNHLYSNLEAAGSLPVMAAPGSNGLGVIQAGLTELSKPDAQDYWKN